MRPAVIPRGPSGPGYAIAIIAARYSAISEKAMIASLNRWNAKRSWLFMGNLALLQPTGLGGKPLMIPVELHNLAS